MPFRNGLLIGTLILKFLIACTHNTNSLPCSNVHEQLTTAIHSGNLNEIKGLINERVRTCKLWPIPEINLRDKDGSTLLMLAASNGDLDIVKFLVAQGADIDIRNKDGETALSWATKNGHAETVSFLSSSACCWHIYNNRHGRQDPFDLGNQLYYPKFIPSISNYLE